MMRKGYLKLVIVLLLLITTLFTGCATHTALFTAADEHADGQGYIYGQFELIEVLKAMRSIPASQTMGIIIQNNESEKKYSFILNSSESRFLQVIAVPPGKYEVIEVEYLNNSLERSGRDPINMIGYKNDFVVSENTAVYIGDFVGTFTRVGDGSFTWKLHRPDYKFDETTEKFKEHYPSFVENGISFEPHMDILLQEEGVIDLKSIMGDDSYKALMDSLGVEN